MDHSKSSKPNMSFPSIKYKVNQEELEEVYSSDTEKSSNIESSEFSPKPKKVEKSSPSILNKYFKAFKAERTIEDEVRVEDIPEKRTSELSAEISGSPIKEYFSKFNKRSDSIETTSDVESIKESKGDINDRWKLFSDFKVKIVQAVEDIKSSRVVEGDKRGSIDNISDSEDNSVQQDLEQNSCASTENQVSSLASSTHNLSDLSPPIISHSSSTITDSEMESTTSNDSHFNVTPTEEINEDAPKMKSANVKSTDPGEVFQNSDEIESGVDALEDIELVKVNQDDTKQEDGTSSDKISESTSTRSEFKLVVPPQKEPFFSTMMLFLTFLVFFNMMLIPSFVMLNGFFIGIWFSYVITKAYYFILEFLGYNEICSYDILKLKDYQKVAFTRIPQILEFEPLKKYEGWVNIYTIGKYDPILYHVSMTQTIFLKLEGSVLRLSFTHNKIQKRALWDEKEHKVTFYEHQICDLEGATIQLLPAGIVNKRHWSKKYPICVILKGKDKVQIQSHPTGKQRISAAESLNEDTVSNAQKNSHVVDSNKMESDSDFNGESPKRIKEPSPENANEVSPARHVSPLASLRRSKEIINKAKDSFKSKRRKRKTVEKNVRDSTVDDFLDFNMDDDDEYYNDDSVSSSSEDEFGDNNIKASEIFKEVMKSSENVDKIPGVSKEPGSDIHPESEPAEVVFYIFGRTGRDKAEWFRRIKYAIDEANILKDIVNLAAEESKYEVEEKDCLDKTDMLEDDSSKKEVSESKTPGASKSDTPSVLWTPGSSNKDSLLTGAFQSAQDNDFWRYMKSIIESQHKDGPRREMHSNDFMWLNAMLGRIAFDTFRNPIWVSKLQGRIQKKLSSLKLPSFMGPLSVTALDMGCEAPQVHNASAPTLDSCGLWLDLQVSYTGRATMTLTTQLNLMSLKDRKDVCADIPQITDNSESIVNKKNTMAVYDSDLEDTAESSSDDDAQFTQAQLSKSVSETIPSPHVNIGNTPAKKLLRMVDKIAANKYFQHVTEYKYVKRAMEGVSNTDLKLNVELCALLGCFIINIPPPPSDRLWFGFRGSPQMVLKAKPIFGSRVINFGHITSWIEKRLCKEFEKILVYPNMEDIIIDSMPAPPVN